MSFIWASFWTSLFKVWDLQRSLLIMCDMQMSLFERPFEHAQMDAQSDKSHCKNCSICEWAYLSVALNMFFQRRWDVEVIFKHKCKLGEVTAEYACAYHFRKQMRVFVQCRNLCWLQQSFFLGRSSAMIVCIVFCFGSQLALGTALAAGIAAGACEKQRPKAEVLNCLFRGLLPLVWGAFAPRLFFKVRL